MGALTFKADEQVVEEYFNGKVVWITGASGGLGEAMCLSLCKVAKLGGLILSARNTAELERVRSRCEALRPGLQAKVLPLDLADVDSLPGRVQEATKAFPVIDVLINNGGQGFRDLAQDTDLDVDRRIMNVNYFSGVALTKGLLPKWLGRGAGHVVMISSVQGFFGLPGRTAYSAAKHAAIGFYDSLRAEVEDKGVTVTTVAPGYIDTNHSQNAASGGDGRERYPEGHTSKGVAPAVMAMQILAAVARKQPELVCAALDARLARLLRSFAPTLLFHIMSRRARKEEGERLSFCQGGEEPTTPLKAN